MKVAVYYSNRDTRIEERPIPKIGPGEVLVKVMASGICGTDVLEWYRIDRVPLVLGHEISGVIEEVGVGVAGYKIGDRVACAHHVPCDTCAYCLAGHQTVCETLRKTNFDPGGFAEFVRLPKINVDKGLFILPDTVSFQEATFVEPLACVLRGQRIAGGVKGKKVLVLGCGVAGILHVQLAKLGGASFVVATDISEFRLKNAKILGADKSIPAQEYSSGTARVLNHGKLFDLVILSTGAPSAIAQAFNSVERGGTILVFAPTGKESKINFPFNELFWRTEITLTSSYAATPAEYLEALNLIAARKLKLAEMITNRLSLAATGMGFQSVADAKACLKVIIEPHQR